jgi:hypothetical protein
VQAFEQGIELDVGEIDRHDRPPSASKGSTVLARVQALRFAPALRAPAAAWTRAVRGAMSAFADGRSRATSSKLDRPGCPTSDDGASG